MVFPCLGNIPLIFINYKSCRYIGSCSFAIIKFIKILKICYWICSCVSVSILASYMGLINFVYNRIIDISR